MFKVKRLCSVLISFLLLISSFPLINSQTVPNPDHMIVARGGMAMYSLDPHRARSESDFELALNVYEPLVFFDREKINSFVPRLAASWSVSADGLNYTFVIRQGVKFHDGETLTTEDVEYSFERILVLDIPWSWVSWLFYDALFGLPGSRDQEGNIVVTASQIDNAVTRNDTTVTIHLIRPYPPFMQILALFGLVMSKDWCAALGEWPGTWSNWTDYNRREYSPINEQNTESPGPHINAMCGTGPFVLDYYQRDIEWSIIRFDNYWGGWPAAGANGSLQRVTVKRIDDWATRRDMFLAGQLDSLNVPRISVNEVLGQPGVRCIYPLSELSCQAIFFTFNISTSSPYLGVAGGLPSGTLNESGIPPDFFHDINVRKGFAYAFNYTKLIDEVLLGEGFQPATPIIPGLPFYNHMQEKYMLNLTKAHEYFERAWEGQLWADGFNMTICYTTGNVFRQKACEIVKANVESINPKFHINIQEVIQNEYRHHWEAKELPIILIGWLADFADPHDFALGFMRSGYNNLADIQNYKNATIDSLVDSGIAITNATQRQEIYYELQSLYWEDCPSVPLYQPRQRRFERDWVQGWYYNPLLGTINYFYVQWKEYIPPHTLNTGQNVVDAVETTGTMVSINTTSEGNLTITSHDINLEGVTVEGTEVHYIKCVTVDTTIPPENITFPIEIRIYYTDQEVVSAYVNQSTLRMYYWNGTSWILENDTGVVTPSDKPGYTGYVWAKIYHLSLFVAMGQVTLIHAITTRDVRISKTVVGQGFTTQINVDIANLGNFIETFNITIYADTIMIGTLNDVTLASGNSATIPFTWNTTGFAKGHYTISVTASPVQNETGTTDNSLTDGWILIAKVGDLGGSVGDVPTFFACDGKVDGYDLALWIEAYKGLAPPEAMYLADLGGPVNYVPTFFKIDGKIDGYDLALWIECYKGLGP